MSTERTSEFMRYLADNAFPAGERLPALPELARILKVSVGKLREQLEVARTLGLVEVRPKTGIRVLPFRAFPGMWPGLRFALSTDREAFTQFEALRNHVEAAFFDEAAQSLGPEDKGRLERLMAKAWERLNGEPIQIPHAEHRELHLTIYSRLHNPYVLGILEAYWEAYETAGLNVYSDYSYLHEVWSYHERIVKGIVRGDYDDAHTALVEHTGLVRNRPHLAPTPAGTLEEIEVAGPGARRRSV
jgi:DNA-binding FadR family transcriptional regulator